MGRGSRRSSAGHVPGGVARRYDVVVDDDALAELVEILTYIKKQSPKNAGAVRAAAADRLVRLRPFPRTGHADPNAPSVPPGAGAFITTVKRIAIYYLFPVRVRDRDVVYVIAVRRGSRLPLEEVAFLRRWMEQLADITPERRSTAERVIAGLMVRHVEGHLASIETALAPGS